MRLIDANALYNGAMKDEYFRFKKSDKTGREAFVYSCAMQRLAEAPTIGGWISVKDRLPDEDGRYIVATIDDYVDIYYWVDESWTSGAMNLCEDGYVTHWMTLPELPKEV